jgi:RNA recognition motif-containing protein
MYPYIITLSFLMPLIFLFICKFCLKVHFAATKDSLSRHFNKFGAVLKVVIVTNAATGQPTGLAFFPMLIIADIRFLMFLLVFGYILDAINLTGGISSS